MAFELKATESMSDDGLALVDHVEPERRKMCWIIENFVMRDQAYSGMAQV